MTVLHQYKENINAVLYCKRYQRGFDPVHVNLQTLAINVIDVKREKIGNYGPSLNSIRNSVPSSSFGSSHLLSLDTVMKRIKKREENVTGLHFFHCQVVKR